MVGLLKKDVNAVQDSLHILTTQIETINQQLAGGGSGGGASPAVLNGVRDVSTKVTYLYQGLQALQTQLKAESQGIVVQVSGSVKGQLDKALPEMSAQLGEMQRTLAMVLQALQGAPQVNAQDIQEIRKTIHELASIYKEEADLFRRQNEFLQERLSNIEALLRGTTPKASPKEPAKASAAAVDDAAAKPVLKKTR